MKAPITVLPILLAMVSCARPSPESEIRATIVEAAEAAANRDLSALQEMISDAYRDDQGRDKRAIAGLAALYLRQNESVYLFTRIRLVELLSETSGKAVVLIATAGQPIDGAGDLRNLRADLNRVEIELEREDDRWRVTSAAWQSARLEDFF